jgi:hypothetical protein
MIYEEFYKVLDLKHKLILYNRLVRGQLKILEYCPEYGLEMGEMLKRLDIKFILIWNNPLILRILHYFLQKSPFKINF